MKLFEPARGSLENQEMSTVSTSTTPNAVSSLSQAPLIGIGKESRTITKEYPVISLSTEAYDWLSKQTSASQFGTSTEGRYETSAGFVIRVGKATVNYSTSDYEKDHPEILILKESEFRGKRVVWDLSFRPYEDLINDLPLVRAAFAEVAQKMREAAKQQDIFVGTDLL